MQIKEIIKKAQSAGIGIDVNASDEENIKIIASSLGVDSTDLSLISNKLNDFIAIKNEGESSPSYGGGNMAQMGEPTRFGEKEYNAARDENGVYDPDFYKKRQEELNQNIANAEAERGNKWKKKDPNAEGPINPDGSNAVQKNTIDKVRDRMNVGKAKLDSISNNIAAKKAAAFNATHPVEAVKAKAQAAVNKAKAEAKKKAKETIKTFIKKHPQVLLIAGGAVLLLLIIIIIVGIFAGAPATQIANFCDTRDGYGLSMKSTPFTSSQFASKVSNYFSENTNYGECSTQLTDSDNLRNIYSISMNNGINPEIPLIMSVYDGCPQNFYTEEELTSFVEQISGYTTVTSMLEALSDQGNVKSAAEMANMRDAIFYDGDSSAEIYEMCNNIYGNDYDYGNYQFVYGTDGSVNVGNPPKYIYQYDTKNFDIKEINNGDISGCSCQSASFTMILLALGDVNYIINNKGIPLATSNSCPEINKYHATVHYYMVGLGMQKSGWHYGQGTSCGGINRITIMPEADRQGLGIKIGSSYGIGNAAKLLEFLQSGWLVQYHIKGDECKSGKTNCEGLGQTSGGHYGLIYGYDAKNNVFLIHDNGNKKRESATASYDAVNNYLRDFIPVTRYGNGD